MGYLNLMLVFVEVCFILYFIIPFVPHVAENKQVVTVASLLRKPAKIINGNI